MKRNQHGFGYCALVLITALLIVAAIGVYLTFFYRTATTPPASTKPDLVGLMDRKGPPQADYRSFGGRALVNNYIVEARWEDIEKTKGTYDFSVIQPSIDAAITTNSYIRLRILSGRYAPIWLKNEVGSVTWNESVSDRANYQIPRFWTASYQAYYKRFVTALSDKYNSNPRISEVTLAMCMTLYAEPLIRQAVVPANRAHATAAGYTYVGDYNCLLHDIDLFDARGGYATAGKLFANTRVSFAVNPYQAYDPPVGRSVTTDTQAVMKYCRNVLGTRCVLGNNSIRSPGLTGAYNSVYDEQKHLGRPLYYQTAVASKIGDWKSAVQWAIDQGASSIELNSTYNTYDKAELAALAAQLL